MIGSWTELPQSIQKSFTLVKQVGAGSFGIIFQAISVVGNLQVAIKVERRQDKAQRLPHEARVYGKLNSQSHNELNFLNYGYGFPVIYNFTSNDQYHTLVMELLDQSLEDLFTQCRRQFGLKTVLMLSFQMISRLEFLHSKGFVHRDIKPENFMIGKEKQAGMVYMIDLGLSKAFVKKGIHCEQKDIQGMVGTARYASINAHMGQQLSRRDDLESLAYVLMYFLRGRLPWQNLAGKTMAAKNKKIMEIKLKTSAEDLCSCHPDEFREFLTYVKALKFQDIPDYCFLQQLLGKLFKRKGFSFDQQYDWTQQIASAPVDNSQNDEKIIDEMNKIVVDEAIYNMGQQDLCGEKKFVMEQDAE